jgi:hypothetical protein
MKLRFLKTGAVVAAIALCSSAFASVITNGFTYSVADAFTGSSGVGTHFHSNTGGSFGNPAGLAEVGRLSNEEVRGLSEYNLAGLSSAATAFVTFDVQQLGGLFGQGNYQGPISIFSYAGNNLEDLSDFQATTTGAIATFNTTGLIVGNILSFDITGIFNTAITANQSSLGIRLQLDPLVTPNEAIVFHDFRLTTDNLCTGPSCANVPEPGTMALLGIALIGFVGVGRRNRQ